MALNQKLKTKKSDLNNENTLYTQCSIIRRILTGKKFVLKLIVCCVLPRLPRLKRIARIFYIK